MQLTLERFAAGDLPAFMQMARQEGWICDPWEFDFLLRESTAVCLALRSAGRLKACITAIAYGCHGWIGNLIVSSDMRRQGLGRLLMGETLALLEEAAVESVWLTASAAGAPLYERLGFAVVDRIERRVGAGGNGDTAMGGKVGREELFSLDASGWGACRTSLLLEKLRLGRVFQTEDGFLVGHVTPSGHQLGPGGGDIRMFPELLERACAAAGRGRVFLDLPAGNVGARMVLEARGFHRCGETLLMCRGDASGYRAPRVWALGTMGSIG
jgi:ribosomal protein S18 acetylase RimI-like enzyme